MRWLAAYWELVRFDLVMRWKGFERIHAELRAGSGRAVNAGNEELGEWRKAVEQASMLYPWRVRCLQRSVALVRILRRHGIGAELVIGVRPQPFSSHAWVEVNHSILNDFSTYPERMIILDRT